MAKTVIAIRRNTAMTTNSLVEQPAISLTRTEVPEGTTIYSFDPTDPANEVLFFLCTEDGTRDVDQHLERPFNLVYWACKKVMMENEETGNMVPAVRTVLIDDENETLVFVSIGVAVSLDDIRTLRGDGPYQPPIPVIFKRIDTRAGFKTIRMKPVPVVVKSAPVK